MGRTASQDISTGQHRPTNYWYPLGRTIHGCSTQMRRHSWGAWTTLVRPRISPILRILRIHFDVGVQGLAFEKMRGFGVPSGTVVGLYFQAARELMSAVQGTHRDLKPSDSMVMAAIRISVGTQYPVLIRTLLPGSSMTTVKTFASIDDFWLCFEVLSTNKTPAINGDKRFARLVFESLSQPLLLHHHPRQRNKSVNAYLIGRLAHQATPSS